MSLKKYKEKRDLKKSREPLAEKKKPSRKAIFVVQRHDATHLHYDFRLEMRGVLKSWAIPKGPSLDPEDKRLAVEVEDHPIEYAKFQGIIPEGHYGAGEVKIWDFGTWEALGPAYKSYKHGDLSILLSGNKLKGEFKLIKMKLKDNPKQNAWLFFKVNDKYAKKNITKKSKT